MGNTTSEQTKDMASPTNERTGYHQNATAERKCDSCKYRTPITQCQTFRCNDCGTYLVSRLNLTELFDLTSFLRFVITAMRTTWKREASTTVISRKTRKFNAFTAGQGIRLLMCKYLILSSLNVQVCEDAQKPGLCLDKGWE